ncbi:MAG: 16S rRNA (guanine(527)-N(7))-methyltransferase RsmG [Aquabacterium sp.]
MGTAQGAQQFRSLLVQGLDALALDLPPPAIDQLMRYLALLQQWNSVYNLTAVRDPGQMLVQHLIDCLAAVPALRRLTQGRTLRVMDVGSGGGLPGLVWATVFPAWSITCVDAVAKKAAFIRQAAGELSLGGVRSMHGRVEQLQDVGEQDLITSRALGSLADLVRLTQPLLAAGGHWLAMKGRRPVDELAELPTTVDVFHVEPLQVPGLDAQRCLVWMRPA